MSEMRDPDVPTQLPEADRLGVPDHRRPDGSGRRADGDATTQTGPDHPGPDTEEEVTLDEAGGGA